MHHELEAYPDPDSVARAGAEYVASTARAAVAGTGRFRFAVSGGRTPWAMFDHLTKLDMPWETTFIYQADERVAPRDHPDRNLLHLLEHLGEVPVEIVPMPVENADLDAAADEYARLLPNRFDLVHLGLGQDGHSASLVPGDPVLEVTDRLVAPCQSIYQGRRRLTLTYPALALAGQLLWLVTGQDKRGALERLLAGDTGIPAALVEAGASLILADAAAVGENG
jgi:6-phosphogluconolactonase